MPKKVDYAVRFAFLREAAFQVVLDRGVEALSRRSLAAALGVPLPTVRRLLSSEADLAGLSLDEIENRERDAFLTHPRLRRDSTPLEAATFHVLTLLPRDEQGLASVLVWLKLAMADPDVTARVIRPSDEGTLPERFQTAERGFVDEDPEPPLGERGGVGPRELYSRLAERLRRERDVLAQALDLVGQHDPLQLTVLSALVRGLGLDLCLGTTTLAEAQATITHHLSQLG